MADEPLTYIQIIQRYWWVGLIAVMIFVIIYLIKKVTSNAREFYSEIDEHKKKVVEELGFNPSSYNEIVYESKTGRRKPLGKIIGYYTDGSKIERFEIPKGIKDQRLEEIKKLIDIVLDKKPEGMKQEVYQFVTFSIKTDKIQIPFINKKFWIGKEKIFTLDSKDFRFDNIERQVVLNDEIDFKYRNGRFISSGSNEFAMNVFVLNELYRTLHDHTVNVMGWQSKKLTEIKPEYAIQLDLKDKDAEIEEKKRKTMMQRV